MKKSDMTDAIKFQFDLLSFGITSLGRGLWNYRNLKNRFWRLYRHDRRGAGILHEDERTEFLPDYFYLVPPQFRFSTWCEADVNQFSANFIVRPMRGGHVYRIAASSALEEIYRPLVRENRGDRSILDDNIGVVALCSCCLCEISAMLCRPSDNEDFLLLKLAGQINDFYQNPPPLERIAASMDMSKSSMNRIFHEKLSISPYQFLLKQRYAYAEQLLSTTELSLKEICTVISVNDVYHFSRMFKRRYGMAPSLYRRKKRENTSNRRKNEP